MKYSTIALIAFSGFAAAQSTLPECAQKCIADSVAANTKCGASDIPCQCETANKAAIQGGATTCVITACGADKALDVLAAANAACAAAGTETSSSAAAVTTSSAAAETTTSAAAVTTSAAGYTTTSAAAVTTSKAAVTTSKSIVTSASAAPVPSSNGTSVAPSPTPKPTQFPGTAAQVAVSFGSIFAMGMAVLAAF